MFINDPYPGLGLGRGCQECMRRDERRKAEFAEQCRQAQEGPVIGAAIGGGLLPQAKPTDHTWILIEGLKRLQGGQQVLDAYDAARGANKAPGVLGGANMLIKQQAQ